MFSKIRTYTCVAALALAIVPAGAFAYEHTQDAVRDARGFPIMTKDGDCVRTKWEGNGDGCFQLDKEARTIYFEFGSAKLTIEGKRRLDNLVRIVKSNEEIDSVNIVGFADRIGNAKFNYRLSQRRAEAVRQYLAGKGKVRVRDTHIEALGDSTTVSECPESKLTRQELIKCLWRDRRVEVVLNLTR